MSLTESEKTILDWLSKQREQGRGQVSWSEFTEKVVDVTGASSYQHIDESEFHFNLIGVTVSIENDKKMYPIRDLEQGITKGYSTD